MKIRKFSSINKVKRRNLNLIRNHKRQEQLRRQSQNIPSWRIVPKVPGKVLKTVHI